jgi:hypothetical protein
MVIKGITLIDEIFDGDKKPSQRMWNVLCHCGVKYVTIIGNLNRKKTLAPSCGCISKANGDAIKVSRYYKLYDQYRAMKRRAKKYKCKVMFCDYLDFKKFALDSGWVEGICFCRGTKDNPNTGDYVRSNIYLDTTGNNAADNFQKTYILKSPTGERVEVSNLNKFCRDNGINCPSMNMVYSGIRTHTKGWTKF